MLTATAAEIVVTDHPYSSCSGSISTPGTARKPAAPTRARNVTAATHHAGWMRRTGTLSSLIKPSIAHRPRPAEARRLRGDGAHVSRPEHGCGGLRDWCP